MVFLSLPFAMMKTRVADAFLLNRKTITKKRNPNFGHMTFDGVVDDEPYDIITRLGRGSEGSVFLCKPKVTAQKKN